MNFVTNDKYQQDELSELKHLGLLSLTSGGIAGKFLPELGGMGDNALDTFLGVINAVDRIQDITPDEDFAKIFSNKPNEGAGVAQTNNQGNGAKIPQPPPPPASPPEALAANNNNLAPVPSASIPADSSNLGVSEDFQTVQESIESMLKKTEPLTAGKDRNDNIKEIADKMILALTSEDNAEISSLNELLKAAPNDGTTGFTVSAKLVQPKIQQKAKTMVDSMTGSIPDRLSQLAADSFVASTK